MIAPSLKICSLNDPNRDRCIKESIQEFLPTLRRITPNFDFPAIDPYTHEKFTLSYRNNNNGFNWSSNVTDTRNYGMSRSKIRNVNSNFQNGEMKLDLNIFLIRIRTTGNYSSIFKNSILNLKSNGTFKMTVSDVNIKLTIKGKLENRNGEDYMKVYEADADIDANGFKIDFTGIFTDEKLSEFLENPIIKINSSSFYVSDELVNNFINDYWRVVYKDILSETKTQWEPLVLEVINGIFSQIPFRRLLKVEQI